MNNKVIAYTILNTKSLLKDKIPFIWSIMLPLVMFLFNINDIIYIEDLIFWWVYMVLCSYIYGVGVYALELKEEGCLRTIFSINNSSIDFFIGNVFTQMIFSFLSIFLFNLFVVFFKEFSFLQLMLYGSKTIILCLPFAFLSYGLTLFKKVHANTIRTVFTILIFAMFMLISTETVLNQYSPMYYVSFFIINEDVKSIITYILFTILSILLGICGVLLFDPNSNERR